MILRSISKRVFAAVLSMSLVVPPSGAQQMAAVPTVKSPDMAMKEIMDGVNSALQKCQNAYLKSMLDANLDVDGITSSFSGATQNVDWKDKDNRAKQQEAKSKALQSLLGGGKKKDSAGSCYEAPPKSSSNSSNKSKKESKSASDKTNMDIDSASFSCDMSCDAPSAKKPVCQDFWGNKAKYTEEEAIKGSDNLQKSRRKLDAYLQFINFKIYTCDAQDGKKLDIEATLYTCQENVLKDAVGEANTQLQSVINANSAAAQGYEGQIGGLGQQMGKIFEILGGDPNDPLAKSASESGSAQFGGLIGLQKQLDVLGKQWTDLEKGSEGAKGGGDGSKGGWTSRTKKLKRMPGIAKAKLERRRMDAVKSCLSPAATSGSGSGAYLCRKEVFTDKGVPTGRFADQQCGGMEHIKTLLTQAAYKRSGGAILKDGTSRANATLLENMFDQVMAQVNGRFEGPDASGTQAGASQATVSLAPKYSTWAQVSSGAQGAIDALQAKLAQVGMGYNFKAELENVAQQCFKQGDTVRTQEMAEGSDSQYQQDMEKYNDERTALTGEIQKGLDDVTKYYGQAVAVLTGNQMDVSLSKFGCSQSNPDQMLDCFGKVRQSIQDIKDGANGAGKVSRVIQGVPGNPPFQVPGFKIDCVGIDKCVTKFSKAKDDLKKVMDMAVGQRTQFVNQANQNVKNQLTGFAQFLGKLQGGVDAQYSKIAGMMTSMGASDVKSQLEHIKDPEQLTPGACGKDPKEGGGMCPALYGQPGSMTKVLSGLSGPQGLLDFNDTKLTDNLASAKKSIGEKKSKDRDALKKFDSLDEKYGDLADTCVDKHTPESVKNETGENCDGLKSACGSENSNIKPGDWDNIENIALLGKTASSTKKEDIEATETEFNRLLNAVKGLTGCDEDKIKACKNAIANKKKQYSDDVGEAQKPENAKH